MNKKTTLSPEDQALFQKEMRGVKPLDPVHTSRHNEPTLPPAYVPRLAGRSAGGHRQGEQATGLCKGTRTLLYDLSDYYANPIQAESHLSYQQFGVGKKQMDGLRKGELVYQGKLDLHGLHPDAAKERLIQFLNNHIALQHRWVLIIHGKGGRFGEAPVLKNLVNHWLPQIPSVLAFRSAQPKHGGTGAVYVLLKSKNQLFASS